MLKKLREAEKLEMERIQREQEEVGFLKVDFENLSENALTEYAIKSKFFNTYKYFTMDSFNLFCWKNREFQERKRIAEESQKEVDLESLTTQTSLIDESQGMPKIRYRLRPSQVWR